MIFFFASSRVIPATCSSCLLASSTRRSHSDAFSSIFFSRALRAASRLPTSLSRLSREPAGFAHLLFQIGALFEHAILGLDFSFFLNGSGVFFRLFDDPSRNAFRRLQ